MIDPYWEDRKKIQFEPSEPEVIGKKEIFLHGQWVEVTIYAAGPKKKGQSMTSEFKKLGAEACQLSSGCFRSSGRKT